MEPKTLTPEDLEVLNLTGFIEIKDEAYTEKGRFNSYSKAFVNCDEDAGDILAESENAFHILELVQINHPKLIEV